MAWWHGLFQVSCGISSQTHSARCSARACVRHLLYALLSSIRVESVREVKEARAEEDRLAKLREEAEAAVLAEETEERKRKVDAKFVALNAE